MTLPANDVTLWHADGAAPRHAEARRIEATAHLCDAFVASPQAPDLDPAVTSLAIHLVADSLAAKTEEDRASGEVPWHRIDPDAPRMLPEVTFMPLPLALELMEALTGFYRWLGDTGRIHEGRAAYIALQLQRLRMELVD